MVLQGFLVFIYCFIQAKHHNPNALQHPKRLLECPSWFLGTAAKEAKWPGMGHMFFSTSGPSKVLDFQNPWLGLAGVKSPKNLENQRWRASYGRRYHSPWKVEGDAKIRHTHDIGATVLLEGNLTVKKVIEINRWAREAHVWGCRGRHRAAWMGMGTERTKSASQTALTLSLHRQVYSYPSLCWCCH